MQVRRLKAFNGEIKSNANNLLTTSEQAADILGGRLLSAVHESSAAHRQRATAV